jgi:hypothetical protein
LTGFPGALRDIPRHPRISFAGVVALVAGLALLAACGQDGAGADGGAHAAAEASPAATPPPIDPRHAPAEGLALIDTSDLREHLSVLAADSLEGRRAGTRGGDRAAAYLAARLAELGVEPAGGGGSYLQRFSIPSFTSEAEDSTQNVVGIVRGADSTLANEFVALGAHYDHLGIGPPVAGDSVYNGADDDGSGTVTLLETAEAFARGPRPRRSILIVFHGAEEEGLLGSFYFTLRPTVPRDSIVTQLNVDMVGRNSPDSLAVIGANRISSALDSIVRSQAAEQGLALDWSYDAPDHPERLYYRSDHYNYAQYGIPVAFFFAGLHADYHMPSDEIDKIELEKIERAARLVYRVAWEVANRPARLARDKLNPPASPSDS